MISKLLRYSTILAAIGGVIAIVGIARLQAGRQMPAAGDPPLPPAPKPYAHAVSATGILEALSENVAIGVPQPGLVAAVKVKVNDVVKTGDVLFLLDDRDLRAQELTTTAKREVAGANIAVAEAELAKVKSRFARFSAVTDERAVSRDDLETLQREVDVSSARLTAARAELSAAASELQSLALLIERLTVRSPRDGTVIQLNIRAGEYAATAPKVPAMIVGETQRLQVRADVDEQNASRIRPGQRGRASLKGDPSVTMPLEFVRVEPFIIPKVSLTGAGTERVDTRVLQVIFSLERPENPPIYVGQQVDVFIEAPEP
ncbi:MAG: biotin/lipoyl-binding protein [Verrucomicrobiaceae bacterium]|nr:MAG: biotin/lipoyl-binding protein [Verrucomicrobiaceae bacterium]